MIVIDTSALMAILQNEPEAGACRGILTEHAHRFLSAGTLAEAFIVSDARKIGGLLDEALDKIGAEIVPVTIDGANRARRAYREWGRGNHSAALNFGDCISYAVATVAREPLLYVGGDFARTDVRRA